MVEFLIHHLRGASKYFGCVLVALLLTAPTCAHDLPLSYVDVRVDKTGVDVTVEASAKDFAHKLSGIKEATLLTPSGALAQKEKLRALVTSRLP